MDDFSYLSAVRAAICSAIDAATPADQLQPLLSLKAETVRRIEATRFKPPIAFSPHYMPGYVRLGVRGHEQTLPHPGLAGLEYAWLIFLHGPAAASTLHALTLLHAAGKRPGNALRNCLTKAAEWTERAGGCAPLAAAMRQPSMSISDAGAICFVPPKGLIVDLDPA
jgi:hypothetical protein